MLQQEIKNWKLLYHGKAYPCSVPCSYYHTLLQNGLMKDPYYRDQEKYAETMQNDDCCFETEFTVDASFGKACRQELVFEGLDTLCDVYLNGKCIGSADNMHRTWRWNVKSLLKEGANTVTVVIHSAVAYFKEQQRRHPMAGNGDTIPGFAHVRKAFYMSGWDWGPTLPDMGIWRPVYLIAYDARIEDVAIRQTHSSNGSVSVICKTEVAGDGAYHVQTQITDESGKDYPGTEECDGTVSFFIESPQLWWPNGYGEQPLYTVTVTLRQGEHIVDSVTKTIGLRTVTVSQEKDEWGREFCFQVNGVKIFSMGANYIPEENFLPIRNREKTEKLIRRCREANFNMLRVWGGGMYPDDWFFDLCDRYGILVWQDCMFACNLIWLTEEMEATIKQELTDNIKRIRHHASLALLCGNNENEEFLTAYMKKSPMELEKADYLRLYCHIIPDLCAKYAPDTFYWTSSPSSDTPFFNPGGEEKGDEHIWTVWSGLKPIDRYRTYAPRFCSEFGFESLPNMETIEDFTLPEDRNLFSEVMERHQKHQNGNGKLMYYIAQYYRYPTEFEKVVYATQLMQARAIDTAVESFRQKRGRCMGAVYWQLNDCWPVASWSSIDYYGRPKALYYEAKKFFAPVLLSAMQNEQSVTFRVSSEQRTPFCGTVTYRLKDTDFHVIWEKEVSVCIPPLSAFSVATLPLSEIPSDRVRDTFLEYELCEETGKTVFRNTMLLVKPKQFSFPKPTLHGTVHQTDEGTFLLSVRATALARKVQLSFRNIAIKEISDQYFDITDAEPISLTLKTEDPHVTESQILAALSWLTEADLA